MRVTGGDPERLRELGWGDAPASAPLVRLDPIGPKGRGAVDCFYHPLRWHELEPELAAIVDEFQIVEPKTISAADYRKRSNFEIEALALMGAAVSRERVRRQKAAIKKAQRGQGDDEEDDAA